MKRLISLLMVSVAVAMFAAACDDRGSVPQAVLDQANKPPEDFLRVPTTQELVSGRRSRTALLPLPLTMELPPGWRPDRKLANILQGYTPSGGEVQIQLVPRPSIKMDDLDRLVTGAKKEMAANPQQILKVDVRPLGTVKVLERQKVGVPAPLTTFDKNNQPHTSTESNFTWTLDVLVPHEGMYQVQELSFIGLTKSQWDQDKDFLNSVLSTLAYAGDVTSSSTTMSSSASPTTAPSIPSPSTP